MTAQRPGQETDAKYPSLMAAVGPVPPHPLEARAAVALERARNRTTKILVAWLIATTAVALVASSFPSLLGWATVEYETRGRVTHVVAVPDGELVTYEASGPDGTIIWGRHFDDSEWDVGDPIEGWVVEGNRFHHKTASWIGPSGFLFWVMAIGIVLFTLRRLVAILIALRDVRVGRDRPRPGYIAFIDNPLPRSWRPLVLIWWSDPTATGWLTRPEQSLLADEDTGSELIEPKQVHIWEALIDTGRFSWMKPRWIAVADGVIVPHRRAFLAAAIATSPRREQRVEGPRKLDQEPDEQAEIRPIAAPDRRNSFGRMLGWRVIALIALAVVSDLTVGAGAPIEVVGGV